MAKTKSLGEYSEKLQKIVGEVRPGFTSYAKAFGLMREKAIDIAPKFMAGFGLFMSENGGGTFVDWCRLIDPTLPLTANGPDGYKAARAYQAAEYMRRVAQASGDRNRSKPTRSNTTAFARLIATILPLISDQGALWKAIQDEFGFKVRAVSNLKKTVASVQPLLDLSALKVKPGPARIIHMPPVMQDVQAQPVAEQAAQPKRGRKRAA